MVFLNMNDEVEVTLTDKGLAVLALDVGETNRFLPPSCRLPKSTSTAWTGPIHELFRIFGPTSIVSRQVQAMVDEIREAEERLAGLRQAHAAATSAGAFFAPVGKITFNTLGGPDRHLKPHERKPKKAPWRPPVTRDRWARQR